MKVVLDDSETNMLKWLAGRLSEGTTYAGLAGILIAFHMTPTDAATWAQLFTCAGMFAGSIMAIVLKDAGAPH